MTKRALIIIDVQYDFLKGGSLEVPNGNEVIPIINALRKNHHFDYVFLTQDWHPLDHVSFASNNVNAKVMQLVKLAHNGLDQVMWPNHCVQGTKGAEFHHELIVDPKTDIIVQKGKNKLVDSYSGFFDNNKESKTELDALLKERNVTEVYVTGLASDYCVQYTARDAASLGYKTFFIEDACRGIDHQGIEKAKEEMKKLGVQIVQSNELKAF